MIKITDIAAQRISQKIQQRGHGKGVRIGIKNTGCSGLAYTFEYVDNFEPDDVCYDISQCKIFVNTKHLVYIKDTVIDYVYQGLNEGFEFRNPNERARCGCGESFTV